MSTSDAFIDHTKKNTDKSGLYSKKVSIDKLYNRLLNVLNRDVVFLMKVSNNRMLQSQESNALQGYLKLVRDLRDKDREDGKHKSDSDLEALVLRQK